MTFATRSDLLARSNARRLAQLAVPADVDMPPESALRIAIAGGDLTALTANEMASLNLALQTIDQALADASALIVSHGIPDTASSPLIARLCSTIALYYLQGAERMTVDEAKAYEGAIATLKSHARGEINLLAAVPDATPLPEDQILIISAPHRYGHRRHDRVDDWDDFDFERL
jgi:phage gp36-like protein